MKDQNRKSIRNCSPVIFLIVAGCILRETNGQFFNTRCTVPSQCNYRQFLQCLNGYCQCDSRSQVYDHKLNQCVLRVGGKCTVNNGETIKCSKNSVCISSVCECQPGYSTSPELLCKPNFQYSCQHPQDCEKEQGLVCLDGSCQCKNASLSFQGIFGCIDATNPDFIEMMTTLKRTAKLLQDNHIDVDEMLNNDLELADSDESARVDTISPSNQLRSRQLFDDSYSNTNTDLTGASQNQAPQQQGLGGILNLLGSLGSLTQLIGGGRQATTPAATGGYSSGPAAQNNAFSLINTFLNLFNRILPIIRQIKMAFNPFRIIGRLLSNFGKIFGNPNNNPGGYPGGSPYGVPGRPSSQYGGPPPPLPGSGGNGGGGNGAGGGTGGGYGAPSSQASAPLQATAPLQAQSSSDFNQQVPVQPAQQQSSYQNFQTQLNQGQNFQQQTQQLSTFENPSQFPNQQNTFQNQKRLAGVQTQNPNKNSLQVLQSFPNNNFNQQQNPIVNQQQLGFQQIPNQNAIGNNNYNNYQSQTVAPEILSAVPSKPPNKYPRQERFSYENEDESPYLPEHL